MDSPPTPVETQLQVIEQQIRVLRKLFENADDRAEQDRLALHAYIVSNTSAVDALRHILFAAQMDIQRDLATLRVSCPLLAQETPARAAVVGPPAIDPARGQC